MKLFFWLLLILLVSNAIYAQDPCEYSSNVTDSLGTYKNTNDYLVYEKDFAGTTSKMYFSLALTDGLPTLNVQMIQRSRDFMKAYCLDKTSRIFLQLDNGKVVTLMHIDQDNCGTSLRSEDGFNNRIMSGYFMFMKESYEELKKSPISFMRIRYASETVDYIFRPTLTSGTEGKVYDPQHYFINSLRCIED